MREKKVAGIGIYEKGLYPARIDGKIAREYLVWNKMLARCQPGFEFDKDILIPANKVYSPDTCVFVPKSINSLMIKNYRIRGEHPIGVSYDPIKKRYVAKVSNCGSDIKLGRFKTAEEAANAYRVGKMKLIKEYADRYKDQIDPRTYAALIGYVP